MNINEKFDEMVEFLGKQKLGNMGIQIAPPALGKDGCGYYEARICVIGRFSMWFGAVSFKELKTSMVEWFYGNEWDVKLGGLK